MKRKKPLTHRIYFDEKDLSRFVTVKVSPAKEEVRLLRTDLDAHLATAGAVISCMNAQCAARSKAMFPHPVYLAEFTGSSAYIVDKLGAGGMPKHAVWYQHSNRADIDLHDKEGPKAVIKAGLAEKVITLRPPRSWIGRPNASPGAEHCRENTGKQKAHKSPVAVGAKKRAIAAGLLFPPTMAG